MDGRIGEAQAKVLESACLAGSYRTVTQAEQTAARKLNGKGMLSRDPKDGANWYPTPRAQQLAAAVSLVVLAGPAHADQKPPEVENLPALVRDASDLVQTIERARSLLDEGDAVAAKVLASGAYRESKAAAGFAAEFGAAGKRLVDKAHRMQADALLIEVWAKIRISEAYDAARDRGEAAGQGRPKNVPDENVFKLADAGLTRKEIMEGRRYREAHERSPGFLENTVKARVEGGLEPSRANLRSAIGTASASKKDRGDNFYQTPPEAMRTLLAFESFSGTVWEPACGLGAISKMLEEQGYTVLLSDLVDRGAMDRHGARQAVGDFLSSVAGDGEGPDIVTNPPYGDVLNDFVAHALRVHRPRHMALLLNLNFLCGFKDEARSFVMDDNPPARVYVFKRRLPMMHREGYHGKKASSRMNTAWFVWELQPDGTYGQDTSMKRVDWADYQERTGLAPGDCGEVSMASFLDNDEDFTRTTPRKTMEERIDESRDAALVWVRSVVSFSRADLRREVGVRDSVAEALIGEFLAAGLVGEADDDGAYPVLAPPVSEAAE